MARHTGPALRYRESPGSSSLMVMDWIKENAKEITTWAIVIGVGGFLFNQMYTLNGDLRATDERVSGAIGRIDRIASVLPDVRIRIAKEETTQPLQAAIVVAGPVQITSGQWVAPVHLIDMTARQRHTYLVPVSGPDDSAAALLAAGAGLALDKDAVSFDSLKEWSDEAQTPAKLPSWLVSSHSLALRHPKSGFAKIFDKSMRYGAKDATKETASVPSDIERWNKLTAELGTHAPVYAKVK